jgi:hypothetical protein
LSSKSGCRVVALLCRLVLRDEGQEALAAVFPDVPDSALRHILLVSLRDVLNGSFYPPLFTDMFNQCAGNHRREAVGYRQCTLPPAAPHPRQLELAVSCGRDKPARPSRNRLMISWLASPQYSDEAAGSRHPAAGQASSSPRLPGAALPGPSPIMLSKRRAARRMSPSSSCGTCKERN